MNEFWQTHIITVLVKTEKISITPKMFLCAAWGDQTSRCAQDWGVHPCHSPLESVCHLLFQVTIGLLSVTTNLVFSVIEFHVNGTIWYVSIVSGLFCSMSCFWDSSMLLIWSSVYSILCWIHNSLFIHSPVDGHLICFWFLSVMSIVAMNVYLHVFLQACVYISLQ